MEPIIMFTGSVGFICAFHILSTAVKKLSKNQKINTSRTHRTRNDWYCFFNIADLTGPDDKHVEQREDQSVHEEHLEQRRQQESKRPRLHV